MRGQVEGREKTYVSRKFVWMSRSFKPESSVRTGRGQRKRPTQAGNSGG